MSYNTDLQNNNTSLQEILATINNLPEAGGSGSSGGGLEWIDVMSLPTTYVTPPSSSSALSYYLPITNNTIAVIVSYVSRSESCYVMSITRVNDSTWIKSKDEDDSSSNSLMFIKDDTDYYIAISLLSTILQAKALIVDLPSN